MAIVENYAQNKRWAQETSNKLAFTTSEYQDGIAYKGNIVSNQLNGISYILSQILQFQQCVGGYYHQTQEYHKGNIVSILHQASGDKVVMKQYICTDSSADGIKNNPPILNATLENRNGVNVYIGGAENRNSWARVDVGGYDAIEEQEVSSFSQTNANFKYCCELCRLPDIEYNDGDPLIKEVKSDLLITTKLGTKSYTVEMKLRGKYIRNDAKTAYLKPLDYWNMPVLDIDFGEVHWHDSSISVGDTYSPAYNASYLNALTTKSITAQALIDGTITPYGFNAVVGYTTDSAGKRYWAIFLCFAECDKITLNGSSNIAVSLLNAVAQSNITIMNVIPTRPHGGLSGYEKLMELREYDFSANNSYMLMLHHAKGEVELRSALTISNKGVGVYWLLSRMQGVASPSLKEHTARHTRCYGGTYAGSTAGQYLEPGLPNVWGKWSGGCFEVSRYNHFLGGFYNSGGVGGGKSVGDNDNMLYLGFNATLASGIYKGIVPNTGWDTMTGTQWDDVTSKSISVMRYMIIY